MIKSTKQIAADVVTSPYPRRQVLSKFMLSFNERLKANKIVPNQVISSQGSSIRIHHSAHDTVKAAYEDTVKAFNLSHDDLILFRAVNDDTRYGVTDETYDLTRIIDLFLPRFKDRSDSPQEVSFASPLKEEKIVTTEEAVAMFLDETQGYIRRRISQVLIEENKSLLPVFEPVEQQDLEEADGEWLINQSSGESLALQAAVNYSPAELRKANMPRFTYLSKALEPLTLVADTTPASKTPLMVFLTQGSNALFAYMRTPRQDDSDIEAIDLNGTYRNLRNNLGFFRENALSILTRIRNGKPAYRDLLNLARRYRGLHHWGVEALIRLTVPLLKPMFDAPESRKHVVEWLIASGVIESYQKHKRFYLKRD